MITPLPGATDVEAGLVPRQPFFGVRPAVVDDQRRGVMEGAAREASSSPIAWPGQMRTVYGDHEPLHANLFLDLSGQVFHRRRLPARRRRLLLDHRPRRRCASTSPATGWARPRSRARWLRIKDVAEAAVVGFPHEIKGQGIYAYVTLMTRCGADRGAAQGTGRTGSARKSARLPPPTSSSSRQDCRRPVPERSCAEFCARSRRMNLARLAIRRRSPIRRWSMI